MMKIYKTFDGLLRTLDMPEKDCWISLVKPTPEEQQSISERYNIDSADLSAALDDDERSRIAIEDGYTLILVDVPTVEERSGKDWYVTLPLAIILLPEAVITVCLEDTPILSFFDNRRIRSFHTYMKTRFVLQILYRNATLFLQYLRAIHKKSEQLEQKLQASTQNRELLELLELEKSLLYFTTSLKGNDAVLDKLLKSNSIPKYPEDTDLLEDVIVENRQAMEMAGIYSGILRGMTDAFASIISNNLNIVMKVLAIVTIVLSIPTMIFSAYGMNVSMGSMPFAGHPFAFPIILGISMVLAGVVALCFVKLRTFR